MYKFLLFLFALALGLSARAAEETSLTIEITKGRERAFALAMVPFDQGNGVEVEGDLFRLIKGDIDISGQIKPLPLESMPALPLDNSQVIYNDWQQAGAEFLLLGRIRNDEQKQLRIEYSLHDVFGERVLRNETLFFNQEVLRDTAHFLSDLVYEEITGLKGVFSTKLAYITIDGKRSRGPTYRLQISDIDGKRPQVLLVSKQPIISPSWSPDGRNIAYVSFERGASNIFIQNLLSGKRRLVSSFRGINGSPAWSPDGRKLALVLSRGENTDVYILDLTNGKTQRITNDPRIDTEPSWSRDGQRLIFTSERNGSPQIFEANLTSRTIIQLTRRGNYNARPRYAENGRAFVYVHLESGAFRMVKQNFGAGEPTKLSKYFLDESPSVAPNGNMVVYSTKVRGKSTLVVVSTDGQVEYQLPTKVNEIIEPAWSNYRI